MSKLHRRMNASKLNNVPFLQKLFDRDHIKIDGKDIGLHIKHSNFTYIKQYIKS